MIQRILLLVSCTLLLATPASGQLSDADDAFRRGVELQEIGRFGEAIKAYDQAIQLGSSYLTAYNNRGAAYGALQQYERAITDFNEAIRHDHAGTDADLETALSALSFMKNIA